MRGKITRITLAVAMAVMMLAVTAPSAFAQLTTKANHDHISIDLNYHGSTVSVSGMSDPDVDLIVKIYADDSDEKLKQIGKVAGVVWMNTDELTFENTPDLYYLRSTKNLDEILSRQQLVDNGIGYDALAETVQIKPAPAPDEKSVLFGDFIKYKEAGNLYSRSVGSFDINPADEGGMSYYTVMAWPYEAPPGKYQVVVYAARDGQVVDTATSEVTVDETGTVKILADMAGENGALYGTAAIAVALVAGMGVGIVFGKGGGAH
jgi:uncharacterized protein (TIGR02186 family)